MGSTGGMTGTWATPDGDVSGRWLGTRGIVEAGAPDDSSVAEAEPTSDWLRAWGTSNEAWFGSVLYDTGLFLRFGSRKQVYGREYR